MRTNLPPLSWLYLASYRAVALVTVWRLRRWSEVLQAVYLRGSFATEEVVPGISDLDFFFVMRNGISARVQGDFDHWWARRAARLPLLEADTWKVRAEELVRLQAESPAICFRLLESRDGWRCVLGDDTLRDLPDPSRVTQLRAVLDDLKLGLTYFNGLLFATRLVDRLEAIRTEYRTYKTAVDLVRAIAIAEDDLTGFNRSVVAEEFENGRRGPAEWLGCGSDDGLRDFVAFTRRHRLRRLFATVQSPAVLELHRTVFGLTLQVLGRLHRDPDLGSLAEIANEYSHFYAEDKFLPTGRPVERLSGELLDDLAAVAQRVRAARQVGIDLVVETEGLWVNVSNSDASLGNCTVVRAPHWREQNQ